MGFWNKKTFVHYLPVFGCFSTGIMYVAIGTIAILSYCKVMEGGADETSFIALLNQSIVGKCFIWIILAGSLCYIAWRFYESIYDPYGYGKDTKAMAMRTGIALSTIADGLIVFSSLRILLGIGTDAPNGQLNEEHHMMDNILQLPGGHLLLLSIGTIILTSAFILSFYGISKGYKERLETERFNVFAIKMVHGLAMVGFLARSFILGIIGFFYLKAGWLQEADHVVNTDKAFDFIGDNLGAVAFILTALGTICYSIFTIALGIGYDADKD